MTRNEVIEKIAAAREAAQNAPMNKVFTDHTGHKFLGTHSTAWASAGREYCRLMDTLKEMDK